MTPKQVRAARALLGWSQADLAKEAGLGIMTIADCELERRQSSFKTMGAIREALERSGVQFTFGKRPGVRLVEQSADRSPVPRAIPPALPGSGLGTFRTSIAFAGWVSRAGVINMTGRYQGFHSLNTGNIEIFWRADGWCWWSRAPGWSS